LFYTLCALTIILLGVGVYRLRVRHMKVMEIELRRLVDERTKELQQEIEEHKRTEEALREGEARFRKLVESNLIGIIFSGPNGTIVEANEAFLKIVGYTREDLISGELNWTEFNLEEYHN